MKKVMLTVILLLVAFSLFAQFRNTKWGMSIDEVKQSEKAEQYLQRENVLGYKDQLLDLDVSCNYLFVDNQLFRASYVINEKHSNDNLYIDDYNKLKKALNKKYKTAVADKSLWKNDLYKDDRSQWGFAISLGHLTYFIYWETKDTDIILVLKGDNYKIDLILQYNSKELKDLGAKQEEKEQESKL